MKRDFDLIRDLLIYFESREDPSAVEVPQIEGYTESEIKYHLILMDEAQLLHVERVVSSTSSRVIYVIPFSLSWEGHDFLEKIRNDNTWQRIKNSIVSKGGSLAYSVIQGVATAFANQQIQE